MKFSIESYVKLLREVLSSHVAAMSGGANRGA